MLRGEEAGAVKAAGVPIGVGVGVGIVVEAEVVSNFAAQARDNIEGEARAAFAC